jgi:hypothetical protein
VDRTWGLNLNFTLYSPCIGNWDWRFEQPLTASDSFVKELDIHTHLHGLRMKSPGSAQGIDTCLIAPYFSACTSYSVISSWLHSSMSMLSALMGLV